MARRGGRPPLGRKRTLFRIRLEAEVHAALQTQADRAGFPTGTYMERVIALAHNFESPFLPPPVEPLPVAVDVDELQAHVASLTVEDCSPPRASDLKIPLFRIDEALGERIYDWCDEQDVPYSSYVRSILRLAAGYRSIDDLVPDHVQGELLDVSSYRGERAKAS